mmetsp:Transcript_11972/g.15996  ORF Transcript_11972/g.15996 Transcript_11972/m.15996 type:complete len:658 (+) Transcript_11972:85-2058(+)
MCKSLATFAKNLFLCVWPIFSIVLGLVCGSVFGIIITLVIFLLTLVRTPMHIFKMLRVTATTDRCFKGHLGLLLRVFVFLLVPLVHILFLIGITCFSATIGMLYYIGRSTKVFYKHEYAKTVKNIESNAKLEPKSYVGKYYKKCQHFMKDDTESLPTIYFLQGCCALIPSILIGVIPFIPFSLAVLGITLYRLPINVYKTIKISIFTVALKWDLKIIAIITLPFVHALFPLLSFLGALVGSFFYFIIRTWSNICEGYSPFHKWKRKFEEGIKKYYKAHKDFVSERCSTYDHPSGIPMDWNGDSYGIPVLKILRWQWDLLVCLFFTAFSITVSLSGTILIAAIKFIPSCLYLWYKSTKAYCKQECATIMGTWPFFIVYMPLLPLVVAMAYLVIVTAAVFIALRTPWRYLENGYLAAWFEPLEILRDIDEFTGHICGEWCILESCNERITPWYISGQEGGRAHRESNSDAHARVELYWDRFISQCIKTTSSLFESHWITLENVEDIDPSAVQSIPAVAILTILAETVNEQGLEKEVLKWSIDGTVCKKRDLPLSDGITSCLWPKVARLKKLLHANKEELASKENIDLLKAMLCANSERDTQELSDFLLHSSELKKLNGPKNIQIQSEVIDLVLAISRVRPYRERMSRIFSHEYETCSNP